MWVVRQVREDDEFPYPASTWKQTTNNDRLIFTCSNGHRGVLVLGPGGWSVDRATGMVTPSVSCTEQHCGFHEHVVLEGWVK